MTKRSIAQTNKNYISIDRMNLTVTNRIPEFQEQAEQEIFQEIFTQLYSVFRKYA